MASGGDTLCEWRFVLLKLTWRGFADGYGSMKHDGQQ